MRFLKIRTEGEGHQTVSVHSVSLETKGTWSYRRKYGQLFLSLESENLNRVYFDVGNQGAQTKESNNKEGMGYEESEVNHKMAQDLWINCRRKQMRSICVIEERGRGERTHHILPVFIWKNFQALMGEVSFVTRFLLRILCSAGAWAVSDAGVGQMGWEVEGHDPQGQNTWEGVEIQWQSLTVSVEKKKGKQKLAEYRYMIGSQKKEEKPDMRIGFMVQSL